MHSPNNKMGNPAHYEVLIEQDPGFFGTNPEIFCGPSQRHHHGCLRRETMRTRNHLEEYFLIRAQIRSQVYSTGLAGNMLDQTAAGSRWAAPERGGRGPGCGA